MVVLPDWMPHERAWLAWPPPGWAEDMVTIREAVAALAALLAEQGPLTVLANPEELAEVSLACGPGVAVRMVAHDDAALRSTGPLFRLDAPALLPGGTAPELAEALLDGPPLPLPLPRLGGRVDVDGAGLALASEALLGGREREPVTDLLRGALGVAEVIWLPAGLEGDRAGGEIFDLARFLAPGVVLAPSGDGGPDAALRTEILERLARVRDGRGRPLQIVTVPQPRRRHGAGVHSYTNFFRTQGLFVLPAFEDHADTVAFDRVVAARLDDIVISFPANDFAAAGTGLASLVLAKRRPSGGTP